MELDVIVVASSRELDEVSAGLGRVLVVHLAEHRIRVVQLREEMKLKEEEEEKRRGEITSTVKGPMEVSTVTSGGPPSALAHMAEHRNRAERKGFESALTAAEALVTSRDPLRFFLLCWSWAGVLGLD